jgi:hypothetical protein
VIGRMRSHPSGVGWCGAPITAAAVLTSRSGRRCARRVASRTSARPPTRCTATTGRAPGSWNHSTASRRACRSADTSMSRVAVLTCSNTSATLGEATLESEARCALCRLIASRHVLSVTCVGDRPYALCAPGLSTEGLGLGTDPSHSIVGCHRHLDSGAVDVK